jgi:hypothetical protein
MNVTVHYVCPSEVFGLHTDWPGVILRSVVPLFHFFWFPFSAFFFPAYSLIGRGRWTDHLSQSGRLGKPFGH